MDAVLMFDVLIYLNLYYYPLSAICHPVMIIAKFFSPNYKTPDLIELDICIVTTLIVSDLIKLFTYRKIRERRRAIAVTVAVLLTAISFGCILYIFFEQEYTLKMEYIICAITTVLYLSELFFGVMQLFPCCKKTEYE